MACDLCGKKMGFMEGTLLTTRLGSRGPSISVCKSCNETLQKLKTGDLDTYNNVHSMINENTDSHVKLFIKYWEKVPSEIAEQLKREVEIQKQVQAEKDAEIQSIKGNMILSTCPSIDGYRVTGQLGLVFGETIFKIGVLKSLEASIENLGAVLTFGDQELGGASRLIEDGRRFAIDKMCSDAASKGANAIIGIEAETSLGNGGILHAYFREYRALQHLCLLILQYEKHQIGVGSRQIYGILFDGAWLWEEYISSLIKDTFYHPMNKANKGAQRLFDGNVGLIYPDFISRDHENRVIADAKYKPIDNIGNKDYLQLLAYMFRFDAKVGYYFYPETGENDGQQLRLNKGSTYEKNVAPREDVRVIKQGLRIPGDADSYEAFSGMMGVREKEFSASIRVNYQSL